MILAVGLTVFSLLHIEQLRKLAWPGIPDEIRPTVWKLLMGYLPANSDRRDAALAEKREKYQEFVQQSWGRGEASLDQALYHQVGNLIFYGRLNAF